MTTAPLAVYWFPCNDTFDGLTSGLGTCPARITVTVPLATPSLLQFTSWALVLANNKDNWFNHTVLDIPPPVSLNKLVLRTLDQTFNTIDGQLTHTLDSAEDNIDHIDEQPDPRTTYTGYAALSLSIFRCIVSLVLTYLFYKTVQHGVRKRNVPKTRTSPASAHTCPGCNRQRSADYITDPTLDLEGADV